jgi:UrcA family protein
MSNPNRSFAIGVSCIVIGLALNASPAFAALSDNPPSLTVKYEELDLSKSAGAKELYRRIKRAAKAVCREAIDYRNLQESGRYAQCIQGATDEAVREVDKPLVSALWKSQTRVASIR